MRLIAVLLAACSCIPSLRAEEGRYLGPSALLASPDGQTLYVACGDARQVAWLDLPTGQVVRRVDLPAAPTGLALTPDGAELVVTCAAPASSVVFLRAATGERAATIPAGHTAGAPVVSPDGGRLYVCNRFSGHLSVIDLAARQEVARVPVGREPIAAAVTPGGRTIVVASHLPSARTDEVEYGGVRVAAGVTLVDAQSLATSSIPLAHGATGVRGLTLTPDGRHALVTHLLSNFQKIPFRVDLGWINVNVVSVVDLARQKVDRTVGLDQYDLGSGNPWGILCAGPQGEWVCVSLAGTHEVAFIGREGLLGEFARRTMQPMIGAWPIYVSLGQTLWRHVELPGLGPRALAAVGSKVYVAQFFSDSLAVVDLQSPDAPAATITLGPAPQLTTERRGELLFNDATICFQEWQSCASCHPGGRMDGLNWDLMNDGAGNAKNTKSMVFSHQTPPAMAEGVRMSAEEAVRSGIRHILFSERPEEEAAAMDAYLQSLRPLPSPHLVAGRLGPAAERGRALFLSARIGCADCHPAPLYTDLKAHDVGTRGPLERTERFDTPTLVEAWRTAPYLHDGRYATLRELLAEGRHGRRHGADLSDAEIDDLVAFVQSL